MTTGLGAKAHPQQTDEITDPVGRRWSDGEAPSRMNWFLSPQGILVLVAVAYAVACATLVPQHISLSWDEIVYTSQLRVDQVPMPWGAHRAWGSVLLMAPVVIFTKSVFVLRSYLIVVAGLAIFAAFRPWVSVFRRDTSIRYTAPLAAIIFATGWFAIFYGSKGYPNLWLAFALIAGTGYFLRAVQQPTSVAPLVGAFSAFAVAAAFRPTDTIAAATPLVLTLLFRRWRAFRPVGAVVAGVAAGTAPWIIEAFQRFGGPMNRLQDSANSADAGIRFRFIDQLSASDGPYLLCTPGLCRGVTLGMAIWWAGQLLIAIVGVWVARRNDAFLPLLLAVAGAAFFAGPYLTFVGGSHPRFLIPAYALLSIALAYVALSWLAHVDGRVRWLTAAILAAGVLCQAAVHAETLVRVLEIQVRISDETRIRATTLADQGSLVAPCLLYGQYTVGLSYYPGCDRVQTGTPPGPANEAVQRALADGQRVVLVFSGDVELPEPYASWQRLQLQEGRNLYAFLSPR